MNKNYCMTIVELQSKLDALSSWRKNELMQAQFLAENAKNEATRKYLCRAWVLIMYAHCDSFLKESTKIYIEYLKYNESKDYNYRLMWLIMRGKESTAKGNKKYISLNNYIEIERGKHFDMIKDALKEKSFQYESLRFFCDWILQIDYSHSDLIQFCKLLKKKRDSIAHGEEAYVEIDADCVPWHHKTIEFMDSFKESIILKAIS